MLAGPSGPASALGGLEPTHGVGYATSCKAYLLRLSSASPGRWRVLLLLPPPLGLAALPGGWTHAQSPSPQTGRFLVPYGYTVTRYERMKKVCPLGPVSPSPSARRDRGERRPCAPALGTLSGFVRICARSTRRSWISICINQQFRNCRRRGRCAPWRAHSSAGPSVPCAGIARERGG